MLDRPRRSGRGALGVVLTLLLAACGSSRSTSASDRCRVALSGWAQQATLPNALASADARLAAMGYRRLSGTKACTGAVFPVPTGIHLLVAEYLGPRQQLFTANFVADTSGATLDRARAAFLAAAKARGFGTPVVKGELFYGHPLALNGGQRDFLGWTVPGHAVIAVFLQWKLPVDRDAPTFIAELANR